MPFDFILPTGYNATVGNITSLLRSRRKGPITNIAQKNAPAFITVVEYEEDSSADYRFATKKFGAPVALSNKFFLQGISEPQQEKAQILETFGEPLVLFFDERTRVYTIRGTFLDAQKQETGGLSDDVSYNWAAAFRLFYNEQLRGTKLANNNEVALLTVNDQIYIGYPTSLAINTDASSPLTSSFSMTWIIVKQITLPPLHILNTADASTQSEEFIGDLKDLYSVNATISGAVQARQQELEATKKEIQDQIEEVETSIDSLRSSDPSDAETDALKSKEQELSLLETRLNAVVLEMLNNNLLSLNV
jgi:hypothetical protein